MMSTHLERGGFSPSQNQTVLDRDIRSQKLSAVQSEVSGLVDGAMATVFDAKTMAALFGAGAAGRLIRLGTLSSSAKLAGPLVAQGCSHATALAGESAVFAGMERKFAQWDGHAPTHSFQKDWARAFINLGSIKLLGGAARGENLVAQHLLTDAGMVAGHHVGHALGVTEAPTGSLAQQMIQAEGTNLGMKGSLALLHGVAPRLSAMERSLDLSLRSQESNLSSGSASPFFPQVLMATAGREPPRRFFDLESAGPEIVKASSKEGEAKEERLRPATLEDAGRFVSAWIDDKDVVQYDYMLIELEATTQSRLTDLLSVVPQWFVRRIVEQGFNEISVSRRLHYARELASFLFSDRFTSLYRKNIFPIIARSLDPRSQTAFAFQIYETVFARRLRRQSTTIEEAQDFGTLAFLYYHLDPTARLYLTVDIAQSGDGPLTRDYLMRLKEVGNSVSLDAITKISIRGHSSPRTGPLAASSGSVNEVVVGILAEMFYQELAVTGWSKKALKSLAGEISALADLKLDPESFEKLYLQERKRPGEGDLWALFFGEITHLDQDPVGVRILARHIHRDLTQAGFTEKDFKTLAHEILRSVEGGER